MSDWLIPIFAVFVAALAYELGIGANRRRMRRAKEESVRNANMDRSWSDLFEAMDSTVTAEAMPDRETRIWAAQLARWN